MPRLYNRTFAGNPPASISEPGNHLIYSSTPSLTVTPDSQSKVYGADDPGQTYVALGYVSDDGVTDTAVTAGLTGFFTRIVGESVGTRAITQGSFASDAGYSISFTAGNTLTITTAPLTVALTAPAQTKIYGADDPLLGGIGMTLTGLVNNPAIVTWNGPALVNDSAVTGTAASLTRMVGENVGSYNITAGSATLSASGGNYLQSFDATNSPVLAITTAPALNGSLSSNPMKVYGASDPAPAGFPVTLSGVVNNPGLVTWNGNVAIDDTANVTGTLTSLPRVAGENVGSYNFTAGTLALNGTAAANYPGAAFVPGASVLNITPAPLTIAADDKSRAIAVPNPPFTASYSGFQFSEAPAVLGGALVFTTPATIVSPAGLYAITPSGQTSSNYTITYVNGMLTVGELPPFVMDGNLLSSQISALQRSIAADTPECTRDTTAASTPSAAMRALAASSGASLSGCSGGGAAGSDLVIEINPPSK